LLIVVRTLLWPRPTPGRPVIRIRRATVQRATAIPSRPSCRQTFRTPLARKIASYTRPISIFRRAALRWARAASVPGSACPGRVLEPAVERRLGKIGRRRRQALVRLAPLAVLAFERLDGLPLVRCRTGPDALVTLGLPHPVTQGLARAADLLGQSKGSPTLARRARFGGPGPSGPRGHEPQGTTAGLAASSLHPRKRCSLRQTRRGSPMVRTRPMIPFLFRRPRESGGPGRLWERFWFPAFAGMTRRAGTKC
jgi:hypothetical protein